MTEKLYDTIIVGAGASGLMTAYCLLREKPRHKILVIEANKKIARKLLASGGGRCNILHKYDPKLTPEAYFENAAFAQKVFNIMHPEKLASFFQKEGLKLKEEAEGRFFPQSNHAGTVRDFLFSKLEEKIELKLSESFLNVEKGLGTSWLLTTKNDIGEEKRYSGSKIVFATGTCSYPQLGGTSVALKIAKILALKYRDFTPSLSAIYLEKDDILNASGISIKGINLSLRYGKKIIYEDDNSLLFTHRGFSGPLAQNISHHLYQDKYWLTKEKLVLELDIWDADFKRSEEYKQSLQYLSEGKIQSLPDLKIKSLLNKNMPSNLQKLIIDKLAEKIEFRLETLGKNDLSLRMLSKKQANLFYEFLRYGLIFRPLQRENKNARPQFKEAKSACGGISLKEVEARSMECKKHRGIYFVGEMLDIDGACGGYNIQFAFISAFLAAFDIVNNGGFDISS